MEARRLLRRLRDAAFELRTDRGDLIVSPAENLTPNIRRRIEGAKPTLINLIGSSESTPSPVRCIDCEMPLPLSGVRCPRCRDACPEPTCASCGATIDGPDLSICDLCTIERQVAEIRERQGAAAKEEEPA